MLGLMFSSKLDWGSYIISMAKTTSKKIGALIRSVKFLSSEVALYLCKSTIHPCMEYCCHIWAGAPSCYLELLDKLQKRICRTVGPSLAASLEPLAHRQNVASLDLFYGYYFDRTFFHLPKGPFFGLKKFLPTESSLKVMRKYFYFVLKALFVLKIFKFLS